MTEHDHRWKIWDGMPSYGEVLYKRATGEAPEMESSKAAARRLQDVLSPGNRVLDVGCGAGHYLRSLRKAYPFLFTYTGIDATENYVNLATRAFAHDPDATFLKGDIEKLPVQDRSHDIVLCMNVLLHLPRIVPAVRELWRATGKTLLIRTLVGEKSFRIKQVREWEREQQAGTPSQEDPLFDAEGEPHRFHYFNIYSKPYVQWLCSTLPGAAACQIVPDLDYNPQALTAAQWPDQKKPEDLTHVLGGHQVNGSILEPWAFIRLDRSI